MNQRKATVSTVLAVLEERTGVPYELNGSTPINDLLSEEDKKQIRGVVFAMFRANAIDMTDDAKIKYQDDKALKSYVSGLVNNWIRKAPEFNGNTSYVAKNSGSKAGSQDEAIVEMKKLLKQTTDEHTKAVIQSAINDRLAEIKPQLSVDASKLPENLRHLVSKAS